MTSFQVRWGIMATGGIAMSFAKDLLLDPSSRGVDDVQHVIAAVASSSGIKSAERFLSNLLPSDTATPKPTPYGSYDELLKDPNVDIVYIATPHSHHFEHAKITLEAGKHVLCEKPLTVNARQAKALYEMAKEKGLFFMEAVWTRFFPISIAVREHIASGKIGDILRGTADLSHIIEDWQWAVEHRLMNKDLAGGSLMDIGPYPFLWILQTMWHTLPKEHRTEKPRVVGTTMTKDPRTGVDIMSTVLLEIPRSTPSGESKAHAVASTAFRVTENPDGKNTAGPAVRLFGTKGELQVFGPIYRPTKYRIIKHDGEYVEHSFEVPAGGMGMFWEADEAARCLRDGKSESEGIPWEESILVAELLDEARKQGGLSYPEHVDFDV